MYTFIEKATLAAWEANKEYTLSPDEVSKIVSNADLIRKLFLLKIFAIQNEIGSGVHKGNDEVYHEVVKTLAEMSTELLTNLQTEYAKYINTKAEESLQKE